MSLIDINKAQTFDNCRDAVALLFAINYCDLSERQAMGIHLLLAQILEALKWLEQQEAQQ